MTRRSDEEALDDLETGERLTGKGSLTRRRTILAEGDASGDVVRDLQNVPCQTGRVLAAIGANQCRVQAADGRVLTCSIRRLVRTLAREARSAVVAGDRVLFSQAGSGDGVIERVEPRSSALSRISRRVAHVIVANVDQAVIVASVGEPDLKLGLIDRFLCSAEKGGIQGIVCINKIDLGPAARLQPIVGQYARLGYPVVLTNALTGEGLDQLARLLTGKETVFAGQSGVGKSSLLNALQPGLGRATGEVSSETAKGTHTTRVAELLALDGGGWVVDTPGVRQMQLWDVQPQEVRDLFIEFRPFAPACRFPGCSHSHETGCAVQTAVDEGLISPLRYQSYVRIITENDEELSPRR